MIDMKFLLSKDSVAGLEFMTFQNDSFYVTLVKLLKEHVSTTTGEPVLQKTVQDNLLKLIETYTGFKNIKLNFDDATNLYMDAGYFSPGHVLNNKGIEHWLDSSETTLYRWFTASKDKIFKGGVDYSTGKVTGAFREVPLEMGINPDLTEYFDAKLTAQWKCTVEDLLAGAIVHELGHAFSACMMMMTQFTDNLVGQAAVSAYRKTNRVEDRVVVLKDSATLLGLKPAKTDELMEFAKQDNDEAFLMYYTKMLAQRNSQRALSVGVTEMTSEVVADMYAIRMGCGKGIIAAIGVLTTRGVVSTFLSNFMVSVFAGIWAGYATIVPSMIIMGSVPIALTVTLMGIAAALTYTLCYFSPAYSGVYNSDFRRMEDAVRQMIAKIKECQGMAPEAKTKLVNDTSDLLKVLEKNKSWYDNTVIYRAIGWVFSGSDFKLREIEHFTQALNNNEMTVLAERLKGV